MGYNQPHIAKKRKSKGIRTKKQLRRMRGEVEIRRKKATVGTNNGRWMEGVVNG